jgi:hypothetical protein
MARELNRLQKQQRLDLCSRLKGSIFNQVGVTSICVI